MRWWGMGLPQAGPLPTPSSMRARSEKLYTIGQNMLNDPLRLAQQEQTYTIGRNMLTNLFRLVQQGQTYTNIFYLLLSFPLGLMYFVLIVLGISLGICLLVLIIGIPLILAFLKV